MDLLQIWSAIGLPGSRRGLVVLRTRQSWRTNRCSKERLRRCGRAVYKRDLEQWYFRITTTRRNCCAELDMSNLAGPRQNDAAQLDRPSGGSATDLFLGDRRRAGVFTTRPDTVWGATFMVLAPELRWLRRSPPRISGRPSRPTSKRARARPRSNGWSTDARGRRRGVYRSVRAEPGTDERIPIWIADYVADGVWHRSASLAVPSGDQRDFEFAPRLICRSASSFNRGCTRSIGNDDRGIRADRVSSSFRSVRRTPVPAGVPAIISGSTSRAWQGGDQFFGCGTG